MPTLKNLMGAKVRGDGSKFCRPNCGDWFEPIFKDKTDKWYGVNTDNKAKEFLADEFDDWQKYPGNDVQSKMIKKVKMYAPIIKEKNRITLGVWTDDKSTVPSKRVGFLWAYCGSIGKVIGWKEQEMEFEVGE